MKIFYFVLSFFLFSNISYAFNWQKCRTQKMLGGAGIMAFSVSSTQYTSSWGGCAMIGKIDYAKELYFTNNQELLQRESARGEGEFLDAYAVLLNCNSQTKDYFTNLFKTNYIEIWGEDLDRGPKEAYESLERVIVSDPITRKGCRAKS